jgi:hypothetical protein
MTEQINQDSSFGKGMKTTFGIVFALFLIGVAIPCATCGGCATCAGIADYSERSKKAEQASSSESGASQIESAETTTVGLGESFSLGDFSHTITKVTASKQVGDDMMGEESGEGATFAIVYFDIKNNGKETATVMTDDFKLRDSQGRTYRPSSNANTALSMASDKDFMLSELQPGIKKTTATVFEVPEDSLTEPFEIVVPEKGLMGSGSATVTIAPKDISK